MWNATQKQVYVMLLVLIAVGSFQGWWLRDMYAAEKIVLSYREAELLKILLQHQNTITPRKDVLLKIWGDENFFHARNMDVYITRLRKHLSKDERIQIVNVRGVGYKLVIGD